MLVRCSNHFRLLISMWKKQQLYSVSDLHRRWAHSLCEGNSLWLLVSVISHVSITSCMWSEAKWKNSEMLNAHLCVRWESSFGLGPRHSAPGCSAVVREAAAGAAAVGERGLGRGLVQRKLEAFILCLPENTSRSSMWCIHSNTVDVFHLHVIGLILSIITQDINSSCVPVCLGFL